MHLTYGVQGLRVWAQLKILSSLLNYLYGEKINLIESKSEILAYLCCSVNPNLNKFYVCLSVVIDSIETYLEMEEYSGLVILMYCQQS